MARSVGESGDNRFPLARPAAHMGKLASPAGTPLAALKEMGGWESVEMVQRYAHLAPEHLSQHARLIDSGIAPEAVYSKVLPKSQTRKPWRVK